MSLSKFLLILCIWVFSFTCVPFSEGAEPSRELLYGDLSLPRLPPGQKNEVIAGLIFTHPERVSINSEVSTTGETRLMAQISGTYNGKSGTVLSVPDYPNQLTWKNEKGSGEFIFSAPIFSERSLFQFQSMDAGGVKKSQTIVFNYKKIKIPATFSRWVGEDLAISLGLMMFRYNEYYKVNSLSFKMTEFLVSFRFFYSCPIGKSGWAINGSLFFTPLVLSNSLPGNEDTRVIGADLKLGYTLPKVIAPWRLTFFVGGTYSTMKVASNFFGYNNVLGPSLSLMLQKLVSPKDTVFAYAKFAPLNSISFDIGNREFGLGVGWMRPLPNRHPLTVQIEYSDFLASLLAQYSNVNDIHYLHSSSIGISGSYRF